MVSGDRSNKIDITFNRDRCLYARSAWTACSLCIDSCPGKAIRLTKKSATPSVDFARCMQCGQCLAACPLEAFESSSFSERNLLNRIEREGNVRLFCFLPYSERASTSSSIRTYQLGTCLAALTPGVLFELALGRTCELSTDKCEKCSLFPRARFTFECNVSSAFMLLSDWDQSKNLQETEPLFLLGSKTLEKDGLTESALSEFSGSPQKEDDDISHSFDAIATMRSSIRSLFHNCRKNTNVQRKQLPLKAKKRHVPSWRMRLKETWARRQEGGESFCPWPVLTVDSSRCEACGICMQLCPTGSIRQSLGEGVFAYSFTPGTCVNCGLCISSCAASALTRDYLPHMTPFDSMECYTHEATSCTRCGLPVLAGRGRQRCYLCTSEPDPHAFVERVKKQMQAYVEINEDESVQVPT